MARLVHEKTARVLLVPVPAAEVVGAVVGVEHPLEVDGGDLPDRAVLDDPAQRAVAGGVPVVERQHHLSAGAFDDLFDAGRARRVDRQRLLDHDIGTGLERADDQLGMQIVARADDDPVDAFVADHLFELVGGREAGSGGACVDRASGMEGGAHGVGLDDRDQFGAVPVRSGDRIDIHLRADSGTGQGITGLRHRDPSLISNSGNVFSTIAQSGSRALGRRRLSPRAGRRCFRARPGSASA